MIIRQEESSDYADVYAVNSAAFDTPAEANLVNMLREQTHLTVSLVAEVGGQVIGHIFFSPVTLIGNPDLRIIGLAPMAVLPTYQKQGVGSALVRAGLDVCKEMGIQAVVVLGHPEFYPRFGFVPSVQFGIDSEYDVPPEVFMALELEEGALKSGRIKYHPAFDTL